MKHNWEFASFTDVATTITPISKVEKSEYMDSGLYPIISQEDILVSGYWNELEDLTPHNKPVVIFGDHTRVLKYVDFEFAVGADGVKIIQPKENVNAKFLYHYLKWLNVPSLGYARHFKLIKDAKFSVPPMEVQQQIVAELDKINEIISDCKEAICNLDNLAQSLFYDYFGDPITNPKSWNVCNVGDKFEVGSGGTPSKTVNEYWENGDIPWIGSNMCQNKIITETDGKFITSLGLENSSAKVLEPNIVLVALVGATIGKVGLLHIPASTNQNIGYIKPNPTIVLPQYLFFVIKNLYSLFTNIGNGKFKMANLSFIRNLPIMLPPLSLQEKFAARIEQIELQKKGLEETIANMQTLLDCRMDYWFN